MNKKILIASLFATLMLLVPMTSAVGVISKNVTVGNQPPNPPTITGPRLVKPGTHKWTFNATDLDGDNVSYHIEWGDGTSEKWIGPYVSGEEVSRSHTYYVYATVALMARAKDTHGAIGDWGTLDVTVSKSKHINNPIFFQFIEQFPNLFPILRHLLRL